jgi:hypothetical protein
MPEEKPPAAPQPPEEDPTAAPQPPEDKPGNIVGDDQKDEPSVTPLPWVPNNSSAWWLEAARHVQQQRHRAAVLATLGSSHVFWPLLAYPRYLMSVAQNLIDQGQFSVAVVVAHMACEVATEEKLSGAFTTKGLII